jgi:hypothetical protein
MRLEDDVDLAESALAGGGEGGTDFGGVVAVIVDDGYAAASASHLEAAIDSAEVFSARCGSGPR